MNIIEFTLFEKFKTTFYINTSCWSIDLTLHANKINPILCAGFLCFHLIVELNPIKNEVESLPRYHPYG
jgi:hypothetical protein